MNEEKHNNSLISESSSENISLKEEVVAENTQTLHDVQTTGQTTYESFFWFVTYAKLFLTRLGKDLFRSVMWYFYSDEVLPNHIVHLMKVQLELYKERESHTATYSSCRELQPMPNISHSVKRFIKAIKSYVLSSEDDLAIQYSISKQPAEIGGIDKEPVFVIVDSSALSSPSSKELLINDSTEFKETVLRKYFNEYIKPNNEMPSTSRELSIPQKLKASESREEVQMVDINLQSENNIALVDSEPGNESIVLAYLRNKDAALEFEGTLLSSKKKSSLLESVPKMETIEEGEQFLTFPSTSKNYLSSTQECFSDEEMQTND